MSCSDLPTIAPNIIECSVWPSQWLPCPGCHHRVRWSHPPQQVSTTRWWGRKREKWSEKVPRTDLSQKISKERSKKRWSWWRFCTTIQYVKVTTLMELCVYKCFSRHLEVVRLEPMDKLNMLSCIQCMTLDVASLFRNLLIMFNIPEDNSNKVN